MRHAVMLVVLAAALGLTAAQAPPGPPATPIEPDLRKLTAAVDRLVALLDAELAERRGTETLRQLGELDRTVLALEAELRLRLDARDDAAGEVQTWETTIAETRDALDSIDNPESELATLIATAGGAVTADRLDIALDDARGELARARARLTRRDAEIADLETTLAARRTLRDDVAHRAHALAGRDR